MKCFAPSEGGKSMSMQKREKQVNAKKRETRHITQAQFKEVHCIAEPFHPCSVCVYIICCSNRFLLLS